jgi:hypothetical protein
MPVTTTPIAATALPVAHSRDAACPAVGRREGRSASHAAYEAATAGTYRCAGGEIATAATDPRAAEIAAAHAGAATTKVSPATTEVSAAAAEVGTAATAAKVCSASDRCGPTLGKARRRQRENQRHGRSRAQDFQTFHDQNSFSRKQTP